MKIKEVAIKYGRTINLGNYESSRMDIKLAATLDPDDDAKAVAEELRAQAKLLINRWLKLN